MVILCSTAPTQQRDIFCETQLNQVGLSNVAVSEMKFESDVSLYQMLDLQK